MQILDEMVPFKVAAKISRIIAVFGVFVMAGYCEHIYMVMAFQIPEDLKSCRVAIFLAMIGYR